MTEGRVSRVWRRASDRWDRSRVPPPFEEGTTWERIDRKGAHIGVRRRVIVHYDDGLQIEETLALAEGGFVASWCGAMTLTAPPEPRWTGYSFFIGSGDPVSFSSEDDTAFPRFGLYAVIVRVPFEAGHLKAIMVLDDRTGEVADASHLVSVGWDEAINGQWWRIDQYHDGERRAAYWLDAQHRLMRSDWLGAILTRVDGQATATGDLSDSLSGVFPDEPVGETDPELLDGEAEDD
ncbi:MAG: hypothetical protein OEX97_12640 [Acidimicrobiia bacterium]|nr:hypothetical protein [Acidimicrobiia bacterium]